MPDSVNDVAKVWKYLEDRFRVGEDDLKDFKIVKVSGDYWICPVQLETGKEIETLGFRFVRETGRGFKPTTYALQFLGDRVSRNIVNLDKKEFLKLLKREDMIERDLGSEGYVALKFEGRIVGCGFYKDEKVSSRIPKGRGKELSKILD